MGGMMGGMRMGGGMGPDDLRGLAEVLEQAARDGRPYSPRAKELAAKVRSMMPKETKEKQIELQLRVEPSGEVKRVEVIRVPEGRGPEGPGAGQRQPQGPGPNFDERLNRLERSLDELRNELRRGQNPGKR
jgi:hypothetical protein